MAPLVTLEPDNVNAPVDLVHYWHVLAKRRWTVLTVFLIVTTLVTLVNFRMKPVYEGRVRVEVEADAPQIQSLNDLYRGVSSDEAFLRTQLKVLSSDSIAWQTIQQLRLAESGEFGLAGGAEPRSPVEVHTRLVDAFRGHLRVELVKNSRMVEVSFESVEARVAAEVANTLVNNYAEYNFRKRYDATRQASAWMERQLDELKAKVEKSQRALVDYQIQHAIVNVGDKQNVEQQRLEEISGNFTKAQSLRLEKESLYELINSNESQVASVVQSETLQRLESKYDDLRTQIADASAQFGPNYPKVARLRNQLNEIEPLIERERKRIVARIRNDYIGALGRERLLGEALAREKEEVGKLNQLLIQHNLLQREFETNQKLYDNLLQRLKDATVSAGLRATNIHVVDPALPPTAPVRPKKTQNIAMGVVGGLVLGVMLAFLQEVFDNSVKTAEDIERLIATPTLAVIPVAGYRGRGRFLRSAKIEGATSKDSVELAVLKQPTSPLAESYRALRTSILLSTPSRPPRTLLVTSGQPSEGKSCTSLNLALTLAQRGSRVVIIDSDLRKSGVASLLGLANGRGLSGVLTGAHSLEEGLQQLDALPNLWVLPGGPSPPNPADLLSSPGMKEVLEKLTRSFEHIVLDSPPVLLVTDATILSTLVDGVIVVVESGATVRGALVRTHKILESAGGRILGAVVNKMDATHNQYYGSYYSHYYHNGDGGAESSAADAQPEAEA